MRLTFQFNPGTSTATEDIATEGPAFDPTTHGKLRDSDHCASAGLLNRAAAPADCWRRFSCLDPSWVGAVEFNPAGTERPAVLTFITSAETQSDRKGQLHVQFALTKAIPEDSDITLHQNHAAPESGRPATAYWPERENPIDIDRYHTLGLPKGLRGERLEHYHLISDALSLPLTRDILSSLANTEVSGLPLVTARDAAAILNTLYPGQHTVVESIATGRPKPLFDKHLTDRDIAQESDRLQSRYHDLCMRHVKQAEANAAAPLDRRRYLPVNQRPAPASNRAAASSACMTFGNTRDSSILARASDLHDLQRLYDGPQGVFRILQMRRYLTHMPARFPDNNQLETDVQEAISKIDHVLGREQTSDGPIDKTTGPKSNRLFLKSRL
ncbi:hypothetical protein [Burkholderia cepacia]|uniref:hypothetical protein n=1 Tax=Burkholderia cepacia TaxID=292 RepID=UPI0012D9E23B|nr:hypothetical protein [Burkholderia cepacia]